MLLAIIPLLLVGAIGIVVGIGIVSIVMRVLSRYNIRREARQAATDNGVFGNLRCTVVSVNVGSNATLELLKNGEHIAKIIAEGVVDVEPDVKVGTSVSVSV